MFPLVITAAHRRAVTLITLKKSGGTKYLLRGTPTGGAGAISDWRQCNCKIRLELEAVQLQVQISARIQLDQCG